VANDTASSKRKYTEHPFAPGVPFCWIIRTLPRYTPRESRRITPHVNAEFE